MSGLGKLAAETFAAGLYALSYIIFALVAYPIGTLADRPSKGLMRMVGGARPGSAWITIASGLPRASLAPTRPQHSCHEMRHFAHLTTRENRKCRY